MARSAAVGFWVSVSAFFYFLFDLYVQSGSPLVLLSFVAMAPVLYAGYLMTIVTWRLE